MPANRQAESSSERAPQPASSLVSGQLVAPQVPPGLVVRHRLIERIEQGVERGLVVVSAPPGAGKTLLLASWVAQRRRPVAWLTVQPEDVDPAQFWGLVVTAIQTSAAIPPDGAFATMTPPPRFDERFVLHLLDACDELPEPAVLVLDDLHLLDDSPASHSLADAVRRGLGNLRLVMSTRVTPPLPLQRLRLSGQLTELGVADLAFTASEAGTLFRREDLDLDVTQLETVMERTEGWAAGLRLAALSLERDDLAGAVARFAGDQRSVADYFMEEVLARQPADLNHFLLHTCVVRQVCAELADVLTGRPGGQRMLERLERENLFVVAVDDRRAWYRYHHLFVELLRHRLRAEHPELLSVLHKRAAAWFAEHQEPLPAVRQLAAAGDWPALARYVNRRAGALLLGVDRYALVAVLRQMPAAVVDSDPEAATVAATACYAEYDAAGVRAHVNRARELVHRIDAEAVDVILAILTTLEAIAAWLDQDAESQVELATAALKRLGDTSIAEMPALPVYATATRVIAAMGQVWTGQLGPAEASLQSLIDSLAARSALSPVIAVHLHGHLAVLKALRGRLRDAQEHAQVAKSIADQSGWLFLPQSGPAELALALCHLLRDERPECAAAVQRGLSRMGDLHDRSTETALRLVQVRLFLSSGDIPQARRELHDLREVFALWVAPAFLSRWYDVVDAETDLVAGDAQAALTRLSAEAADQPRDERPKAHVIIRGAGALLIAGRASDALAALGPLRLEPPADVVLAVESWLITALAQDHLRRDADAQVSMGKALELAAAEGIVRPFLMYGRRVRPLLLRHERMTSTPSPFDSLVLSRTGGPAGSREYEPPVEPLTERERSVLVLLPAMMSNSEIADEIFVSVNTVKSHLKSIYRKLGVTGRREAVLAARELGLFAPPVSS